MIGFITFRNDFRYGEFILDLGNTQSEDQIELSRLVTTYNCSIDLCSDND